MAESIIAGTILIDERALLPESLRFESESYAEGWKLIKNLDGYGLDRKVRELGWTFFYMADEINASVISFDREKALRGAVRKIIANMKSDRLNSLEITRVVTKSFLGFPVMSVSAHPRHIQQSMELCRRSKRIEEWNRTALSATARA